MPYINDNAKARLSSSPHANGAGELNYQITMYLINYMDRFGLNYQSINECLGALEGAKAEFYRRVAVPHENNKITENGDVYPRHMTGD